MQSTKQMLDELDALMEKMLALPVNDPEDAPAFPREVAPTQAVQATLTMLQSAPPIPAPIAAPPRLEAPPHPPFNPPHLEPLTNDAVPASLLPKLDALMANLAEEPAPVVWVYWPLLWFNQVFDGCMSLLGLSVLRTPSGRLVLGVAGIALLAASFVWLGKDWLGWRW